MSMKTIDQSDLEILSTGTVEGSGHMEPNPDDSFKSSGTGVNTMMIVMDKW